MCQRRRESCSYTRQPAECATLLPAAPNSQTEEQKCFITYLYSQFIFVLQTFRDAQEYLK